MPGGDADGQEADGENLMQEVATSYRDEILYEEMSMNLILEQEWIEKERGEQGQKEEYAWDDVNNTELPIEKVREANKEEMKYKKTLEAYWVTGKGPIGTKCVDTENSHGNMVTARCW